MEDPRGENVTANFKNETCVYRDSASYRFRKVTIDPEKADGLRKETGDEYWLSGEELERYYPQTPLASKYHQSLLKRSHLHSHMGSDSIGTE